MFKTRDLMGALGVMLSLIALYLVLTRATSFATAINAVGGQTAAIFRTLQGR